MNLPLEGILAFLVFHGLSLGEAHAHLYVLRSFVSCVVGCLLYFHVFEGGVVERMINILQGLARM